MAYTVLVRGKTHDEHLAEINLFTIYNKWYEVFSVMYPGKMYRSSNVGTEVESVFYNGILVFQYVDGVEVTSTKLPYADFEIAIEDYKLDSITAITEEFDVEQDKQDRSDSIDQIKSLIRSSHAAGLFLDIFNPALIKKQLVDNSMDVEILAIKAEDDILATEDDFKKKVRKKKGRIEFGSEVVAIINQLNEDKGITTAQLQVILSNVEMQTIIALLQTGSINTAAGAISAIDVTSVPPITEADKTYILSAIAEYLTSES